MAAGPQGEHHQDNDRGDRLQDVEQGNRLTGAKRHRMRFQEADDIGPLPGEIKRDTHPHYERQHLLEGLQRGAQRSTPREHPPQQVEHHADQGHRREQRQGHGQQVHVLVAGQDELCKPHPRRDQERRQHAAETFDTEAANRPGVVVLVQPAAPDQARQQQADQHRGHDGQRLPQDARVTDVLEQVLQQVGQRHRLHVVIYSASASGAAAFGAFAAIGLRSSTAAKKPSVWCLCGKSFR